ncbi:stage II sporulation protein R [Bacillus sp. FJAT-45350]|uniref:stage II sporulation protein R n=1 Tax=Bacillus sp. FJAT-45350 TaxID=2011014 RepID=UPI000BB912C8|nr:stage II sporulation protein R [Bacillus sp. FJAT-45350]
MNQKVIIYLLFSLFVLMLNWESQKSMAVATFHQEVNQDEAIRLRILANSDSIKDQWLKREIRNEVNEAITEWVETMYSLEDAKDVIVSNIPEIEAIVAELLESVGMNQDFTVEFNEVQFPTKLYGNLVYPAGEYDAVLITLGEGNGENWWCVLFPPLCFVDFANGDAVEHEADTDNDSEQKDVEVQFFVVEMISGLLDWFKK